MRKKMGMRMNWKGKNTLKHRLSVEIGGEDFTHVIEKGAHGLKGGDDVI
jgi:hypothetical protein